MAPSDLTLFPPSDLELPSPILAATEHHAEEDTETSALFEEEEETDEEFTWSWDDGYENFEGAGNIL